MVSYYFYQNTWLNLAERTGEINFLYHINLFDWPIEHGHRDYWEFTIVTNGALDNCCNGKVRRFESNSVLIATTRDVHCLLAAGEEPVRYINIMVRESFLKKLAGLLAPDLLDFLASGQIELILPGNKVSEIEQILLQVNYANADRYLENDRLTCSAFLLVISAVMLSRVTDLLKLPPSLIRLNQLKQNNELLRCNVNDLCKQLGYSRAQLNSMFKKHFGIPPHRYLTEYKFNHARKLLENTNMTIAEIAASVGYAGSMQFFVTFRNLFGVTPSEYRKTGHPPISRTDRSGSRDTGGKGPGRPKKATAKKAQKQKEAPLPSDRSEDGSPTENQSKGVFLPENGTAGGLTESKREVPLLPEET